MHRIIQSNDPMYGERNAMAIWVWDGMSRCYRVLLGSWRLDGEMRARRWEAAERKQAAVAIYTPANQPRGDQTRRGLTLRVQCGGLEILLEVVLLVARLTNRLRTGHWPREVCESVKVEPNEHFRDPFSIVDFCVALLMREKRDDAKIKRLKGGEKRGRRGEKNLGRCDE